MLPAIGSLVPALRWLLPYAAVAAIAASSAWGVQGLLYQARLAQLDAKLQRVSARAIEDLWEAEKNVRLALEAVRETEHRKATALEAERAAHLNAMAEAEAALADSRQHADSLRRTIAAERRRAAEAATAAGGNPAAAEAPWVVLEECRREYAEMGRDADELNEQARLAAGYARAVNAE